MTSTPNHSGRNLQHELFQLHIDGKPHRPAFGDIREAAADAVACGFAAPNDEGLLVLHRSADIHRIARWRCCRDEPNQLESQCKNPAGCAYEGKCLENGSCNNH